MSDAFVRVRIHAPSALELEIAVAEAWSAGAAGIEEATDETVAWAFVPEAVAADFVEIVRRVPGARVGPPVPVPDTPWSDAWKEGLGPVVISPRLCVRPPFSAAPPGFIGAELVIEPGQAFGTGHHASTRLALTLLDQERSRFRGGRVLDVGCGSGVLALAATELGAVSAVGFDLDPLAGEAATRLAADHDRSTVLQFFTGPATALRIGGFDAVVANMIRTEVESVLVEIAAAARPGGLVVFSGLLAHERERFSSTCEACELRVERVLPERDGGDDWLGLVATRT